MATTNYGLILPVVNSPVSEDQWGDNLNEDLEGIDTLLRQGICNTIESSQTTGFAATASISVRKLYPCNATGAAFAATLPTASSAGNGATVSFKKTDASANAITITRAASDTIDGATTKVMDTQYDIVSLSSDGVSAWTILTSDAPSVFTGDSGSGGVAGLVPAPAAGDTAANKFLRASGAWASIPTVTAQGNPSSPTGTANTSGVMMGLAQAFTPTASTKILIMISGNLANTSGSGTGKAQIRYGTGAAPANGGAVTGTTAGGFIGSAAIATTPQCFATQSIVTGLSLNTAYWIDISLAAVTTGTASASELSVSVMEV